MNWFEKIVFFLQGEMQTPTVLGWYHILWLFIVVGTTILMAILLKNADNRKIKRFLLITGLIMLILEIYKQIVYSYDSEVGEWDYQWYAFPFQFCSSPMYIFIIAGLVKEGKFQEYLYSFLGTFALLSGILTMLYPETMFISMIGINIQTMVHHGALVVAGVVLIVNGACKLKFNTILKAICVFASLVFVAMLLNCIAIWTGFVGDETFNMFYISPYFESTLPVFNIIWHKVNYFIFLFLYVFAFSVASFLILLVAMGISLISKKIKQKHIRNIQN
ncbi:MAG: YwaF family protein [Clostridia bacterium]|nr:YwaF family protein [Clostridia bacterium]